MAAVSLIRLVMFGADLADKASSALWNRRIISALPGNFTPLTVDSRAESLTLERERFDVCPARAIPPD